MEPTAAEHASTAIFAAEGPTRHKLVRAAIVGGAALLAAWLTSLALGILAGYDGLPVLPSFHSGDATQARPTAPAAHRVASPSAKQTSRSTERTRSTTSNSSATHTRRSAPSRSTSAPSSHGKSSSSQGQGAGTTRPAGKPVGSPGNGPGGSGAPGQLR